MRPNQLTIFYNEQVLITVLAHNLLYHVIK